MKPKIAIIIGAGPAGLTAAYELLETTDIVPVVLEMTGELGGISKTVLFKGNRIDIGGHRFFSKSSRIMQWWLNILPLQSTPQDSLSPIPSAPVCLSAAPSPDTRPVAGGAPSDDVMLIRQRISRIFFLRKFFDYPIRLSVETLVNLGMFRSLKIGLSYLKSCLAPIRAEKSLEDFFINRFGRELYQTFFKDYTEKVWGVSCDQITPEWGAQRIKGLSVTRAVRHALQKLFGPTRGVDQKQVETSLIEQFLYPKLGPGQIWEKVAASVVERGGRIVLGAEVVEVETSGQQVVAVRTRDQETGELTRHAGDYFFSSMPVKELIRALGDVVPTPVQSVAGGLQYRDFMTVGLLLKRMKLENRNPHNPAGGLISDNWIYIQEREVRLGRLQIFNNWSPCLVADPDTVWLGLEYFCSAGDDLWSMPDRDFASFAIAELASLDMIDPSDVLDATVLRMPKAYPAYFGSYPDFHLVREYTDRFANLFLVGRNGMHRYNNADHSMLSAMTAVENIVAGRTDKSNIWDVNTEEEYYEVDN
jgi:protoporphyrinogen oxidase